ncbi:hypothetical protein [Jannaschia pohangensis]|uniref:Uncharacterized protein n=1 Tax=Jannaschia pohangensis TaxID=390807 RepID=A0A1I3GCQ5_9RHOB|nr:hypothetical protein [Jannaschia pohangensis]SFI21268.1 hypothetical protein SAMN04488095_0144 [Jannaschia pohangensis]
MSLADDLADKLAARLIEHIHKTGDEEMINIISKSIGDSSQTLQEAFITSIRVQRAAIRADELLDARILEKAAEAKAKAAQPDETEATAKDAVEEDAPIPEPAKAQAETRDAPKEKPKSTVSRPAARTAEADEARKTAKAAEPAPKTPEKPAEKPEEKQAPKGPWDLG